MSELDTKRLRALALAAIEASYPVGSFGRSVYVQADDLLALLDEIERVTGERDALQKSNDWNAAHAKMMARAADTEKTDREVFRLALRDTKEQLATMAADRDALRAALEEACDIAGVYAGWSDMRRIATLRMKASRP